MSKIPTNRFIKTARVELFQNPDRTSMDEIVKCSLEKVEKILKIYLECKIELFIVVKDTYDPSNKIFGYLWTRDFQHLSTSITKLTLQMIHVGIGCFDCLIVFENLERLDFDFRLITFNARTMSNLKADDQKNISNFCFYFPDVWLYVSDNQGNPKKLQSQNKSNWGFRRKNSCI